MSIIYEYEYEYELDFPDNLLMKGNVEFIEGHIIASRYDEEVFLRKYSIIPLETGLKVGEYIILTLPVDGYLFAVNFSQDESFDIYLLDSRGRIPSPLLVAQKDQFEFFDALKNGLYKITIQKNCDGLKSISVPDPQIFDSEFTKLISDVSAVNSAKNVDECYWICDSEFFASEGVENYSPDNYGDDYGGDMEDTWDAITGGAYDDMPDGWDGDMEFMGH